MATAPKRVKVKIDIDATALTETIEKARFAVQLMTETTPIHDQLKADIRREQMANDLLADSLDPSLSWWHRYSLRREARDLMGRGAL